MSEPGAVQAEGRAAGVGEEFEGGHGAPTQHWRAVAGSDAPGRAEILCERPDRKMPEYKTTVLGTVKVKLSGSDVEGVSSTQELVELIGGTLGGRTGVPGGALLAKMIVHRVYEGVKERNTESGGRGAVLSFRVGGAAAAGVAIAPFVAFPVLLAAAAPFAVAAAFPTVSGPENW